MHGESPCTGPVNSCGKAKAEDAKVASKAQDLEREKKLALEEADKKKKEATEEVKKAEDKAKEEKETI